MAIGRLGGGPYAAAGAGAGVNPRRDSQSPDSSGSGSSISVFKFQKVQEDIPKNNSEKKDMLNQLHEHLLQIIFDKVADPKILSSLKKTCTPMYRYITVPIKGTNYVFSDIQLMRSVDCFLQQNFQLNIDKQLLRSILQDLKKIESAFSVPNGKVFKYTPPSINDFKNMDPKKYNLVYLLTIGEMTLKILLDKEIKPNIKGISILDSKTRGYTLPIKK